MNYELAKQLWEGGYPFKRRGDAVQFMCACTKDVCEGPLGSEFRFEENLYPEPTLSELIEACGRERFLGISLHCPTIGTWVATTRTHECFCDKCEEGKKKDPDHYFALNWEVGEGLTPEEAVATLWLALHK